jgi:hypothetical protein
MNPYLARLQAMRNPEKHQPEEPSKPSKPSPWVETTQPATDSTRFEGFEGDRGRRFLEHHCSVEGDDARGKNPKNATPAYPQNFQNLEPPSAKVEIVELPQAPRYRKVFALLQLRPPALVEVDRWRQCVKGGSRFLAKWGEQAEVLGWTSADLFGLNTPPEQPHPSYRRLSRYDATGLVWLLQGKEVIALTADTATIRNPHTGAITVYRKYNKPGHGPVGDSLEDFEVGRPGQLPISLGSGLSLSGNWPKNFNDFKAFVPGHRACLGPCPGRQFVYFDCFGYCT